MPKYWGGNYFAHGRFPEVGQKQKTEERERKKEKLKDGNNNGQLRIANTTSGGACKAACKIKGVGRRKKEEEEGGGEACF